MPPELRPPKLIIPDILRIKPHPDHFQHSVIFRDFIIHSFGPDDQDVDELLKLKHAIELKLLNIQNAYPR
jgi:hypothetical protein